MGGGGPDVLLIHGTLMTLEDMWLGPADALARAVPCGCGGPTRPWGEPRMRLLDASPWRQAEIMHEAMSILGLHRPTIVGHSAGGAVALAYGMLFPDDVAGIIALAPICFPEPRLEQMLFGPRAMPFAGPMLAPGRGCPSIRAPADAVACDVSAPTDAVSFREDVSVRLGRESCAMVVEAEDSMALGPGLVRSASVPDLPHAVEILGGDADIVVINPMHGLKGGRDDPRCALPILTGNGPHAASFPAR